MSEIYKQGRKLHVLGFGVHWLRPKSKAPVDSGWTTGERKPWAYLKETYFEGLNVGTRLGSGSPIAGGFLAVIDVDVKSTDETHRLEAVTAAKKMLGNKKAPIVKSGRGNGSRHYYVLTKTPFKAVTPFRSSEEVKVFSPSKKASKRELSLLTTEEIEKGLRLSPAWEVSLYSEGRQVVLPPSIHPDSGKPYLWFRPSGGLTDAADVPLVDFSEWLTVTPEKSSTGNYGELPRVAKNEPKIDFVPEEVDLDWVPISDKIREGIKHGTDVTDRSSYLLPCASALVSAGLSTNAVLSVLTDPNFFIGSVGYDHAKTKDRRRAAEWVFRYSLRKIEAERDPAKIFEGVEDLPVVYLTDEEREAQQAEFGSQYPGFYRVGPKGGRTPEYCALMRHFNEETPFKTIADMKAVYIFNGTHFEHVTPIQIKAFAETSFVPSPDEKIRTEFLNKVLANNIATRVFFTQSIENRINFKNGVLNLETEKLEPHSPEYGFRGVLPYDYDPEARCPVFEEWLNGIMLGNRNLAKILQEFMGYIVRGGPYKYHKALWLGGVGRNGKSTFIDLLKDLIGTGNFSTISIKSLVGDRFVGSDLDGKIANFSEETSPQELADSGPFKNLTGDGDISAQKKYGDPFHFRNRAKLVMTYNQIPDLKDLSAGMLSRPIIVPFLLKIKEDEQDRNIKAKLSAELSGIFNFALEGWHRLEKQNGFTKSNASEKALGKIKDESCNVVQWVQTYVDFEDYDPKKGPMKSARELYTAYRSSERFAYRPPEFFRRLRAHPEMQKRHKKTENGSHYLGVKV